MRLLLAAILVVVSGSTAFGQTVFAPPIGAAVDPFARQPSEAPLYRVLVTGEVRYPGRVTLTDSTMTVADALAAVGSPTINAGDDVIVIQAVSGAAPTRRIVGRNDIELANAGVDLTLQDGDIVNVPLGKRFYISGFVKHPGAYRLQSGMTVSQAIILVGGLSDGGNDRRIKVGRVVKGKSVDVSAQLDDKIQPDDQIKVPRKMF
jgi:polysaccharide biosynthesis/export protein